MSTITGVGPALDLDGPLPKPRRFSLLQTPGVIQEEVADGDERVDWMIGVNVYAYPAGTPHTWEPCTTGTNRVKEDRAGLDAEDDEQPIPHFDPIAVYFPLECSSFDAHRETFTERAELVLEATLSHGVEEALAKGVMFSNNPSLGDTNLDILAAGAAVAPRIGLSYLENAIGDLTGRQGMIHSTPGVVAAWGFGAGLTEEDVQEEPPPRVLRSPNGTPIISGSGYIGTDPVNGASPTPGGTSDWVFATGPVEVRVGDGPEMAIVDVLDRETNTVVVRPEKYVLYDWDTALQVGVLIDWTLG
jgi:hypothetical protein